jgi:hypothetical protein
MTGAAGRTDGVSVPVLPAVIRHNAHLVSMQSDDVRTSGCAVKAAHSP